MLPKYDIMILDYANFPLRRSGAPRAELHHMAPWTRRGARLCLKLGVIDAQTPYGQARFLLPTASISSFPRPGAPSYGALSHPLRLVFKDFWTLQAIDVVSRRVCS